MSKRVLIYTQDAGLKEQLQELLTRTGYTVRLASSPEISLTLVGDEPIDVVLYEFRSDDTGKLDCLQKLKMIRPEISVIILTALRTVEDAVEAMRRGADNFVLLPLDPPRLLVVVEKGLESGLLRRKSLQWERVSSRRTIAPLGKSKGVMEATALAVAVAPRDTTVLISGATGTGKGLIARLVHDASPRRTQPFVELNCAGLQRELTESELFGHERGAFTGAIERKIGLFEAASGGTLFLDEIGEMDYSIQAKLLKVLEEKRFRRIGGVAEIEVDVRLIAATNRTLEKDVADGRFRQDLFYRLNVFNIQMPPLKDRKEDLLSLARHFLHEFRGGMTLISEEAGQVLLSYDWPGNIRELRNVMERAAILCPPDSPVLPSHLPSFQSRNTIDVEATTMRDVEKRLLESALKTHNFNLKATADHLGISRGTLYRKIKKYNIT